jgi:hypothetical protein
MTDKSDRNGPAADLSSFPTTKVAACELFLADDFVCGIPPSSTPIPVEPHPRRTTPPGSDMNAPTFTIESVHGIKQTIVLPLFQPLPTIVESTVPVITDTARIEPARVEPDRVRASK